MKLEEKLYDALAAERARGGPLTKDRWLAVARLAIEEDKVSRKRRKPGAPAAPRERNPLFDALATLTGTQDISQITGMKAKTIGCALAEIKTAKPDVTTADLERVVDAYRRAHPTWPCTPMAIAKNWDEFARAKGTRSTGKPDIYREPEDWKTNSAARDAMNASEETWQLLIDRGWFDLAPDIRATIVLALR